MGLQARLPAARLSEPRADRRSSVALLCALFLVGGCMLAGWWLTRHGVDLHLGSAFPLSGQYGLHAEPWLLLTVAVALCGVLLGPYIANTSGWRTLLTGSFIASAGWAVSLAAVAGPAAIPAPLTAHGEYLAEVDRVNAMGVGTYLDTFTRFIVGGQDAPEWTTHVAGHPPLVTLLFAPLARAGLAGPGWAAALCIAGGAAAAPAVLSALKVLAGERTARRAAVFVVFAPTALWVATSADALFAGVAAWGICALAHAARAYPTDPPPPAQPAGRPQSAHPTDPPQSGHPADSSRPAYSPRSLPRACAIALTGGLLLGTCLMLSYGLTLLAPVAAAVVLVGAARTRARLAVPLVAGAGVAAVLAVFAAAGFSWFEGFELARERVMNGPGWRDRPTAYFLFANPAAVAVAAGPAVVAALPLLFRMRVGEARRLAAPAVAALLAMALAVTSNLSKGEVERIYLPFTLWLLPLAALLPTSSTRGGGPPPTPPGGRSMRSLARLTSTPVHSVPDHRWLAAQAGWTVLVAVTTTLHW